MSLQLAELTMFSYDVNVKPPSSNVRRNLFGTPQKDTLNQVLGNQEKSFNDTSRFIDRWGFDPSAGRPVSGSKYDWEAIKPSDVPSFYTKTYAPKPEKRVHDGTRKLDTRQQRCNTSRPLGSAKRKLNLCINDENYALEEEHDGRVSCKDQVDGTVKSLDCSNERLCPPKCVSDSPTFGLISRSSSSNSLPDLSVSSPIVDRDREYRTPRSPTRQSAITDYLPLKKKICLSSPQANKRT